VSRVRCSIYRTSGNGEFSYQKLCTVEYAVTDRLKFLISSFDFFDYAQPLRISTQVRNHVLWNIQFLINWNFFFLYPFPYSFNFAQPLLSAIACLSIRPKWISRANECQKCRIEQRAITSMCPHYSACEIW